MGRVLFPLARRGDCGRERGVNVRHVVARHWLGLFRFPLLKYSGGLLYFLVLFTEQGGRGTVFLGAGGTQD